MGFFLPSDIPERISKYIDGNLEFPFIDANEILGIFFLFGKDFGIKTSLDVLSSKELARKTIDQITKEMFFSKSLIRDSNESIRENYQKRILQIYVDYQNNSIFDEKEIHERIIHDPSILITCYSQHIVYYNQKCFFEIFDPFLKTQLEPKLYNKLLNRMIMLSYNREKSSDLPFHSLVPFFRWIYKN